MELTINTQKCKVMTFHRTREFIKFDSFLLVRVTEVKDLEFIYVPLLDFRPHIDFIVWKGLRILGFIRRHSSNFESPKCFCLLYRYLVRSSLEYGAIFLFPYTLIGTYGILTKFRIVFCVLPVTTSIFPTRPTAIVISAIFLVLNRELNVVISPVVVLLMGLLKKISMHFVC